jgi:Ca2+-binding RTX toxin-like protein
MAVGDKWRGWWCADGRDLLAVTNGRDQLFGKGGGDGLVGKAADDVLYGGPGDDEMGFYCYDFIFDTGEDVFNSGPGNDFIWSWDFAGREPHRDLVYCGGGRDEVLADRLDRLFDCEKVERVGRR